jgi:holo-[acyl-carrier protein] synthase
LSGSPRPGGSLVGLGVELVSVPRFEALLERHEARLLGHLFQPAEIAYARRKAHPSHSLAARFAAKAAGRRALLALLERAPLLRDLEVVRRRSGEPTLVLRGPLAEQPPAPDLSFVLTLTHDHEYALASVFAERA